MVFTTKIGWSWLCELIPECNLLVCDTYVASPLKTFFWGTGSADPKYGRFQWSNEEKGPLVYRDYVTTQSVK